MSNNCFKICDLKKIFLLCGFFTIVYSTSFSQSRQNLLLKSAKIFDSKKGEFTKNVDLLIEGNKIHSVGNDLNASILPNTQGIDLKGHTIVPGLIDMHTHVLENLDPEIPGVHGLTVNILTKHDTYRAIRAIPYLKSYLNEGFTTIRDVGNSGQFGDVALKKAVKEGFIESPRLFVSGPILSSIGGQIAGVLDQHQNIIGEEYRIINNKDDAIQAVREHVNQGVDLIKICTDNSPNRTYLTVEEIKQITNIAHEYGLKVTAHANTPKSIENALLGNVDGIEHGYLINDTLAKKLNDFKTFITVTDFYLSKYGKEYLRENNTPDASIEFITKTVSGRLKTLIDNDNLLVFGSDVYVKTKTPRGKISKSILISYNTNYNIPISKVLQMATYNAALALGKEDVIGNLKSGMEADLLILNGDLESDIKILDNVKMILKAGVIYQRQ